MVKKNREIKGRDNLKFCFPTLKTDINNIYFSDDDMNTIQSKHVNSE